MMSNDEQVRAAIAEQAGEWLVTSDEGPMNERDSEALAAWLKASPVHVEDFLGVSVIARDLRTAGIDPEYSLEACLALAQAEDDTPVRQLRPRAVAPARSRPARRWRVAAVATVACAVISLGLFTLWNARPTAQRPAAVGATLLHFETRHGEQLNQRLADGSVLHLNTDSAVTVRYGETERLVTLTAGQAGFEVAHAPDRPFRVLAGSAEVVAVGTMFDVHLRRDSTVVTVVEGRVVVGPSATSAEPGARSNGDHLPRFIQLGADQQISVTEGRWPAAPAAVDAQRTTAWLRRQIVFDQEPLERVAAEFNRYAPKPVEIATPALRTLEISGVFATDDAEAFVAFLRSLNGVRVEVTATRIRVSRDPQATAPPFRSPRT